MLTKLIHESTSTNQKNQTSASTAIAKLPPVFCRTRHLADWQLDDPSCYSVAGLQFKRFTLDAGRSRIYQSNPHINLTAFCGVLIDRWNRHRVIIATQILAMIQSLALAFLALTGVVNIWQLLVLSWFQGAINAFDAPASRYAVANCDRCELFCGELFYEC
jgi:Transmembrane secretion effector